MGINLLHTHTHTYIYFDLKKRWLLILVEDMVLMCHIELIIFDRVLNMFAYNECFVFGFI